jgi:hypothetical protein
MAKGSNNEYENDFDGLLKKLARLGIKFKREEKVPGSASNDTVPVADATRLNHVGINTLGKLDFLKNFCGYRVNLPEVDLSNGLSAA